MSAFLVLLVLFQTWWRAATVSQTEDITVTVTTTEGEERRSTYRAAFDPSRFLIILQAGPLVIEADERGVWAMHQRDPTTTAVLTQQPIEALSGLFAHIPATPLPRVALGEARPASSWHPLPDISAPRWTSARILREPGSLWPSSVQLHGSTDQGQISLLVAGGDLHRIDWIPSEAASDIRRVTYEITPATAPIELAVNREASRVSSLFALEPLGPPVRPGQRLPGGMTVNSLDGPTRLDAIEWPADASRRVLAFVRAAEPSAQTQAIEQAARSVRQAVAKAGVTAGAVATVALVDGTVDRGGDAASRLRAVLSRAPAGGGPAAMHAVFALTDQRRYIERLETTPGVDRSACVLVITNRSGVILEVVSTSAADAADRIARSLQ